MSKCSLTFSGLCLIGFLSATSVLLPSMVLRTSSPVGIALSKRGLRNNMLFIEPFPAQSYHPNTNTSAAGVCGGGGIVGCSNSFLLKYVAWVAIPLVCHLPNRQLSALH